MKLFRRPFIYFQVHRHYVLGRVAGESRAIRRDCHALDNSRAELKDFSRITAVLRGMIKELAPDFSFRRPVALMHFVPEHYVPTQGELAGFKQAAERAGLSFCYLSKWETPHTDQELKVVQDAL